MYYCHGDVVSAGLTRSGHELDLTNILSDFTTSATQSGFADCITAAFIDEVQSRREILVPRRAAEGCHGDVVSTM